MKKILFTIALFLGFALSADASSATINVSSNYSQVVVGNSFDVKVTVSSASPLGTWDYSLNYDSSIFTFKYSSVGMHVIDYATNTATKSKTYTYTFVAKASGTGRFYANSVKVVDMDTDQLMSITNNDKYVKVITRAELEATYSKNNNLKSLGVDGFELDKEFKSDVTEYSVVVPPKTESINISALKADSKSSISGTGKKDVTTGLNVFEIIVTAQNGSTKKYKLNVTVEELDPIIVKIDGDSYTVVRESDAIVAPTTYQETSVLIDGKDVPGFYGEILDYTLVGLKDSKGDIALYIYDDSNVTYKLYQELSFNSFSIIPEDYDGEVSGYSLKNVNINGVSVKAFVKDGSEFYLIYGVNTQSGKSSLYKYDTVEKTLQRYEEESSTFGFDNKLVLYSLCGALGFSFLVIVILLCKRSVPKVKDKNIFTDSDVVKEKPKKEKIKKSKKSKKEVKIKEIDIEDIPVASKSSEDDEMFMLFDKKKK